MVLYGWLCYIVTAIGLWFIASPWVYGFTADTGLMWNNVILGAVAAVLSFIVGTVLVSRPEGVVRRAM